MWLKKKWSQRVLSNTILELDFTKLEISRDEPDEFVSALFPDAVSHRKLVDALRIAAQDPRVTGLVAKMGNASLTFSMMQDLRDAVLAFKQKGKKTVAFAESFGEFSSALPYYWLASAFDEIYIPHCGSVNLTGMRMTGQFLRGTLDKLGIVPEFGARKEYKTAPNAFTDTKFSDENRETLEHVMQVLHAIMVKDIAAARGLTEPEAKFLIAKGPFDSVQAQEQTLVTALAYLDELYDKVLPAKYNVATASKLNLLYLTKYATSVGRQYQRGKSKIAVVKVFGGISTGESTESSRAGSDTVIRGIRQAVADRSVKAILLHVDSPGGSYIASDMINREIVKAKESGKKIVVSMGQYAASGGYYVSLSADKVVAQSTTITGSIGVFAGKFNMKKMWGKIGLSFDHVETSENASYFSSLDNYSEEDRKKLDHFLDFIYADFTSKVAKGRNMSLEATEKVAKGRVWMGEAAKDAGLVDEIGNFDRAVAIAKELCNIPADTPVKLVTFPTKPSFLSYLVGARNSREAEKAGIAAIENPVTAALSSPLRPFATMLRTVFGFLPVIHAARAAPAVQSLLRLLPYLVARHGDSHLTNPALMFSTAETAAAKATTNC